MPHVTPFEFHTHNGHPDDSRCVVDEIEYQRNGVCGAGFFQLRFRASCSPERPLLGVVFTTGDDERTSECYAVVDPNDLSQHWRGDHFVDGLLEAIRARYDEMWPHSRAAQV